MPCGVNLTPFKRDVAVGDVRKGSSGVLHRVSSVRFSPLVAGAVARCAPRVVRVTPALATRRPWLARVLCASRRDAARENRDTPHAPRPPNKIERTSLQIFPYH